MAKAGLALVAIAVTHTAIAVDARPMKTVRRALFNMTASFPETWVALFISKGCAN